MRKIAITLMAVVLIIAIGMVNSMAAEKVKYADTRYWFTTKSDVMKLDDIEGHVLMMGESKGVDVGKKWVSVAKSTYDLVKGNGTMRGYSTTMDSNGKVLGYATQEGKVTTTLSQEGKPVMEVEGTFSMFKGVGEWEGSTMSGTWKMKRIAEGIYVMEWQGERVKP